MGEKRRKSNSRERRGLTNESRESVNAGRRSEDRETLYGIYCHCRRNPKQAVAEGLGDFMELVEETTYSLTEIETRRFLKRADGKSPSAIAAEEGCRREAVLGSVAAMIKKNDYCSIAAEFGCLRQKKNQYEYGDCPKRRCSRARRTSVKGNPLSSAPIAQIRLDSTNTKHNYPEDVLADDGCPNFP